MNRAEKALRIRKVLDDLYVDPPIPLHHTDAFTLLVAVVLSAQTTDARVNMVTPALFALAPDAHAMAKLSVAEIHELIRTCGLAPAKAKNIAALAKILVEQHKGQVPRTFEELEALPGVGHKTASVVMAQAFGIPAFPVDTHIHRLAERWGLSDGSTVEHTERDLKAVFPESAWIPMHLKIILFGREHCPALRHDMSTCEICSFAASKARIQESHSALTAKKSGRKPTGSTPEKPTTQPKPVARAAVKPGVKATVKAAARTSRASARPR